MSPYANEWQAVKGRIDAAALRAGRNPAAVTLVVVSKTFAPEAVRAVHALGQRAFGENYVQEALAKMAALRDLPDLEWHLIGPLQTNKARAAAGAFAWVHSVDRLRLAQRLSDARDPGFPPLQVCVQVNVSGEPGKSGVSPEAALELARAVAVLPRLALRGFMTIAEETADSSRQRDQFRRLAQLLAAAREEGLGLDTLSMGMSADLEAAIAEGATVVRIGSAIFGTRQRGASDAGAALGEGSGPGSLEPGGRNNRDTAARGTVAHSQPGHPQR
jgi:pyridoxal phosphate enzyme (YggS family)